MIVCYYHCWGKNGTHGCIEREVYNIFGIANHDVDSVSYCSFWKHELSSLLVSSVIAYKNITIKWHTFPECQLVSLQSGAVITRAMECPWDVGRKWPHYNGIALHSRYLEHFWQTEKVSISIYIFVAYLGTKFINTLTINCLKVLIIKQIIWKGNKERYFKLIYISTMRSDDEYMRQ